MAHLYPAHCKADSMHGGHSSMPLPPGSGGAPCWVNSQVPCQLTWHPDVPGTSPSLREESSGQIPRGDLFAHCGVPPSGRCSRAYHSQVLAAGVSDEASQEQPGASPRRHSRDQVEARVPPQPAAELALVLTDGSNPDVMTHPRGCAWNCINLRNTHREVPLSDGV